MKTISLFLMTLLLASSCCSQNPRNLRSDTCNENLKFKKIFFDKIDTVEKLVSKNQNAEFWLSLKFISKYAKVSYEDTTNYSKSYPYGTFLKDKKGWLSWYEEKKCTNIQLQ